MAFSASADSSRAQLRYVVEAQPGVTPDAPTMKNLRFTGESLSAARTTASSAEIRADRNIADLITTGESATGDINVEYSFGTYDDFLESALQGVWTDNVLKNGVTRKSFTIEKEFSDVGKFEYFRGCEVTQMAINMSASQFVTGSFGIMARKSESGSASIATVKAPATTTPVFNTTYHMTGLTINGGVYSDGIQSLAFSLNNNAREQRQIGSKDLAGVGMGSALLTGTLNCYFGNATVITDAYDTDTPVEIQFILAAAGSLYTVTLPAVKFSGKKHVAGGINTDVQLEMTFQSVIDDVEKCEIKIERLG